MFIRTDDKITATQTAIFLNNTLLGAGVLTLPRSVSKSVGTPDGWISTLLGGAIVMLAVLLMVKISQQFPGKTVFQYSRLLTGRFIGGLLSMLLILYFITIAGFEIRTLAEVTLFFLLEGTPIWGSDSSFSLAEHLSRVRRHQFYSPCLHHCFSDQHYDSAHLLRAQPADVRYRSSASCTR